ncbi:carotenoid 1,2-hydratase [Sulfitobacter sp. LCG007]
MSHDQTRAISIIGFIGSVFSPWYAWSGRRDPADHCCINVVTCGPGGRFAMTDRGCAALRQAQGSLEIGPSSMKWTDGRLIIDIDEAGALPRLGRIRGTVTLAPCCISGVELALTGDGAHVWRPFAPTASIDVRLDAPGWQWQGHGYFDANFGTRALEKDFDTWTWGRYPLRDGCACFYDATLVDGVRQRHGFGFGSDGSPRVLDLPTASLPRSGWAVERSTRSDAGHQPAQVKSMLDAPFYSRSLVRNRIEGEDTTGVHEALDLRRFRSSFLKVMLACRVPRRAGWTFSPTRQA